MPRLWSKTIETHRHAVRDAILDAAAEQVAQGGLLSVTMSRLAERTGIGRATLYKYFPDVDAVLAAWHERQVSQHLAHLMEVRDAAEPGPGRLAVVLRAYARLVRTPHGAGPATELHEMAHVDRARSHLHAMVAILLADGVEAGEVRSDVPTDELSIYCLHSVGAATGLRSDDAVERLIAVTMSGLRADAGR